MKRRETYLGATKLQKRILPTTMNKLLQNRAKLVQEHSLYHYLYHKTWWFMKKRKRHLQMKMDTLWYEIDGIDDKLKIRYN